MGKIYGGHLVAKYLRDVEGVSTVFSIPGGHIDRIYDGFLEYGTQLVVVRHEQAAAMMAHAWSIFKGQPGVCLVTAGPGFTNALTGVVNAYLDNAPLVLLSGAAPVRDWRKGALQEMNQADMIKPVVKWCETCYDIRRIPEYLSQAFRYAVSGRPGPVFLELPPDILGISVDEGEIVYPAKGSVVYKTPADAGLVREAAALINRAERPVMIGGSGIGFSNCDKQIREFVDKTGIPFILFNNGRGTIPDDHPLSLWDGGQMSLMTAAPEADLVLALGIRFNWLLMYGEAFPQAKLIHVDIDPAEVDRNRRADVGIVGDIGAVLSQLNKEVDKREHKGWIKRLRDAYLPLVEDEIKARQTPSEPIHPVRLVEQVRKAAGDDALYIVDGGDTSYFGMMGLKAREKSSVIVAAGGLFGCLGTGVPFGIAAKLARPEKTAVVINGDGAFGFNAMEFDTAVRHNIPFVCVICNDQAWGMIKHGQEMSYDRVVGSGLGVIHYEKVVEALGGYGEFVTRDEETVPAIERAIASGKPACVNVLTDPTVTSPATVLFVTALTME